MLVLVRSGLNLRTWAVKVSFQLVTPTAADGSGSWFQCSKCRCCSGTSFPGCETVHSLSERIDLVRDQAPSYCLGGKGADVTLLEERQERVMKRSNTYHIKADYFPITARPEVFYSSYSAIDFTLNKGKKIVLSIL